MLFLHHFALETWKREVISLLNFRKYFPYTLIEYAECSTNWARINRNSRRMWRFAIFSLTIVIKKAHLCFGRISSKINVPRKAAVELILQLECWKRLLILLEENNYVKVEGPWPRLFDLEKYDGSLPLAKSPARSYWLILIVLQNLPNMFQLLGLAHMRVAG